MTLSALMGRPELTLDRIKAALPMIVGPILERLPDRLHSQLEEELKYAAFVDRECREAAKVAGLADRLLPSDNAEVPGLRTEAKQQLIESRPRTFGEARQLPGVTPADIAALLIHSSRLEAANN
jgi:tRNA uridine 5-carboxymethylaminomethyl modification enzyme